MKKIILIATPIIVVLLWLFVGFDRYVGDHEVGTQWDPFIKHKPTATVFFQNPAQIGLDIAPFDTLDEGQRKNVIEYCQIRFGVDDVKRCYEVMLATRV